MNARTHLLVAVLIGLFALPAFAQIDLDQTLPRDPAVLVGQLDNGLTYYIRENHKPENRAELRLVVNAGSILEEEDQQGLAHFLEHMAFNGTEHFEANDLISYLESIGAKFGPDLNAYTSFDETVYILEIPTDKEGLLEQGMVVLGDWASTIRILPEEVEKERGVVLEEWRGGQGVQERLRRTHWPVLLAGSRYAERLPIGKPEIIEHGAPERIRAFYETWYRPDLMAVVAVGAFDPKVMEGMIRDHFGSLPKAETALDRPEYPIPAHEGMKVSIATDKEMPYAQVVVYYKRPHRERGSVEAYRDGMVDGLVSSMFNARFSEITEKPGAPFKFAGAGGGSSFRTADMYQVFAVTDEGKSATALEAALTEVHRVTAHGFGEGELARAKANLRAGLEQIYNEREKTESGAFVGEYVRNFLEDEPFPGIEAEYRLSGELMEGITLEDIRTAVARLIHDDDMVILVSEPDKEGVTAPTADALLSLAREVESRAVDPYQDTATTGELLAEKPKPGTVVSRREEAELGATVVTLSNGVEVWLKPTDFKNDEILFSARTAGGTSQASEEDYPSATIATALVAEAGFGGFIPSEMEKLLAGKIVSVSPTVDLFSHGISGQTTPRDLETALQAVYLTMTAPNPRPEAFDVLKERYRTFVENRTSRPEARFSDTVQKLNFCDHYTAQPPTLEWLDQLDRDKAMAFYRKLYTDASDFRFFFVGAMDVDATIELVAAYLGALPSQPGTPTACRKLGLKFPEGTDRERVFAGSEPKSQTQMTWPAKTGLDEMEMFYLNQANDILEIRLRDVLREELGGTYGVGVGSSQLIPSTEYGTTTVGFGSSPENADKLVQTVLDEVARFKAEGPSAEEVATIQEQGRRGLEKAMEQNGYWLGSFTTVDILGWDPHRILARAERIESVTPEILHQTIQRYYPADRYTAVSLMPEESREGDPGSK